jgi:hypothetical protein
MENNMEEPTITLQKLGMENGWIIYNVKTIGVNVKRGGKGNETTAWVSLEMPADRALPVAVQYEGENERPADTVGLDEVKLTLQALLAQVDAALTEEAGW